MSKNVENITIIHLKIIVFTAVKNFSILHRHVMVIIKNKHNTELRLTAGLSSCVVAVTSVVGALSKLYNLFICKTMSNELRREKTYPQGLRLLSLEIVD